ncbi:hypothetical protein, partial [Thioclava indica]
SPKFWHSSMVAKEITMLEWPESFIPSFLIDADQEAQKARDARLSELFHQPLTLRRLRSMRADPFYRPLMELDRNSATDFALNSP